LLWRSGAQQNVSHAIWLNPTEIATSSADASIVLWQAGEQLATLWTRFAPDVTEGRKMAAE